MPVCTRDCVQQINSGGFRQREQHCIKVKWAVTEAKTAATVRQYTYTIIMCRYDLVSDERKFPNAVFTWCTMSFPE